jgi:pimeloyl-ACP methyl ester carboxylesterase
MSSTKVIALHGNPGSPSDWLPLQRQLPGVTFLTPSLYDDHWIQEVRNNPPKSVVLVAHSYGAYLCLANLPKYQEQVRFVLLCAPFLAGGRELTGFVKFLLQLPFLGDRLKKISHQKIKNQLFQDIISPLNIAPNSPLISPASDNQEHVLATVKANIDNFETWKQVLDLKIKNSKTVLTPHQIRGISILGEQDLISEITAQRQALAQFPQIQIQVWPKAGHGLIWSDTSLLAEIIKAELTQQETSRER